MTEAGIVGTWVVGVLAIFGERIRAMVFRPKLHLALKSSVGIYTTQTASASPDTIEHLLPPITKHARYYHLRVTNRAIYPTAQDVQVLLLGVERVNDEIRRSGELYVPLMLGWAGSVYPLNRMTALHNVPPRNDRCGSRLCRSGMSATCPLYAQQLP